MGAQLGVGHRHLECGGEDPVDGRAAEELWHLWHGGEPATPGGRCPQEARDSGSSPPPRSTVASDGSTLVPSASATHSPQPSPFAGDDADEEQRPEPVHPGRGDDGDAKGTSTRTSSTPASVSAEGSPTPPR